VNVHFTLRYPNTSHYPAFSYGTINLQGLKISRHGFFNTKICDRTAELDMNSCYESHHSLTSKRLRLELYDKRTKNHLYVLRNICSFKELICTFNVLRKFATIRRRPSEAIVLFQLSGSKRCKAVGEVWPETRCRNYRSQSDSYRASPMLPNKRARQPGNVAKSECLFYWGLRS